MLVATPVHFRRIERGSGVRATVTRITNAGSAAVEAQVAKVRAPFWVDVGRKGDRGTFVPLAAGSGLSLAAGEETELDVRLDTAHPEFPTARAAEEVEVELASGESIQLRVFLDEVVGVRASYDGVVAIDFGTSNTCYSWKDDDSFGPPRCSAEIPSVIFFRDVSDPENPSVSIGAEAEHDVREKTHQVSSYFSSLKRLLGGAPVRVLDGRGNTAWYSPERIVGFYVREVVRRLEKRDLERPVARVVATYPPSFDERRVAAVRKGFEHALGPAAEAPGAVTVRLDEVSAAAFDHVYGRIYRTFRELKLERRTLRLLAIDFGGGTLDAVALDVTLERRPRDATRISVKLLGATGEPRFGGDEVTKALVELLQKKLALAVAAARSPGGGIAEAATGGAGAAGGGSPLAEVLRALASRPDDDDDDEPARGSSESQRRRRSPLATTVAELAAREGGASSLPSLAPAASGLARFTCRDEDGLRRALARVSGAKDTLERSCDEGASLGHVLGAGMAAEAESLEDALDVVVPVRPERRKDADPAREEIEKALHCELWQEAERLKRRLSDKPRERLAPSGELVRLARWAGVDAGVFQRSVQVTLEELEAVVYARIKGFMLRAKGLLERLEPQAPATTITPAPAGVEVQVDLESLRRRPERDAEGPEPALDGGGRPQVLLCGNGSRLPAVRRAVREVLSIGDDELAWTPDRAKPMVAQGAAEEEAQRRHFGGEFVEVELDGFVERLPYAIGLFHPELRESPGFRDGFFEVFGRGARAGEARMVGDENPLVHPALERLKLYASDLDGAPPRLLGKFDLGSEPVGRVEPEVVEEGAFRVRFDLGANREVRLVDLARGTVHALELAP